jgi:hypothetical protein
MDRYSPTPVAGPLQQTCVGPDLESPAAGSVPTRWAGTFLARFGAGALLTVGVGLAVSVIATWWGSR